MVPATAPDPAPGSPTVEADPDPFFLRPWVALVGVAVVAFVWFAGRADRPGGLIFDEPFYFQAAHMMVRGEWITVYSGGYAPFNREHPPLGKMLFALIATARPGDVLAPRLVSTIFGAAGVAGTGFLAWRLTGSRRAMFLAPLLLLLDPMWDLHARMVLLDVIVAASMVWAFGLAFIDHPAAPYAAGVMAGLGAASKFIALILFPALAGVLYVRSRLGRYRVPSDAPSEAPSDAPSDPSSAAPPQASGASFRTTVLAIAIIPTVVMFLAYAPIARALQRELGLAEALGQVLFLIIDGIFLGSKALQVHNQSTHPLAWVVLFQPMQYHFDAGVARDGLFRLVVAYGSPVVWWGGLLGAVTVLARPVVKAVGAWQATRHERDHAGRRLHAWARMAPDHRLRLRTVGVVLAIFVSGFLPFLLLDRATFIYYMVLLVPYLAVLLALVLDGVWAQGWGGRVLRSGETRRIAVMGVLVLAVVLMVWWWPIYTAAPMDLERFSAITETIPWSRWPDPGDLGRA